MNCISARDNFFIFPNYLYTQIWIKLNLWVKYFVM
jgi:hypothetical protein